MFRFDLMRGVSAGAIAVLLAAPARAETQLPTITIGAAARTAQAGAASPAPRGAAEVVVEEKKLAPEKPRYSDTARLLADQPGVSMYTMGGVSGLPVIRGMADERVKVLVGGVQTTSACSNHMNSPLSYTDPNTIDSIDVVYGVSSVSKGGDSTGGSILVKPRSPVFAPVEPSVAPAAAKTAKSAPATAAASREPLAPAPFLPWGAPGELRFGDGKQLLTTGSVSSFYRGVNNGYGVSGVINMATEHWSLLYNGSFQRADNYRAGGGAGQVYSTNFQSENHGLALGYQNDGHRLTVRGSYQNIPYQGFPNMRMDMTRNKAYSIEAAYQGAYSWGTVDARAYWSQVAHKMGFLDDRSTLNHPMKNNGRDFGYSIKAEIPLTARDLLRLGNEYHGQRLQDYWPTDLTGYPGALGRPFPFVVINGGQRDRVATYVEWERAWLQQWTSVLGFRNDTVWMDTNTVQSYNPFMRAGVLGANNIAANLFNGQDRSRANANFDMTAIARYKPTEGALYEFGYSRKTRSPSLYEKYLWPVTGPYMAMFNWLGDGNGYVGNVNLSPEVAHNVSVTGSWKDTSGQEKWEARVTPFYSYVENYIAGGRTGGTFGFPNYTSPNPPPAYVFQVLQFRNFNAQLFGVDGFGKYKIFETPEYGRLTASATVSWVYGENLSVGNPTGCPPNNGFCSATAFQRKRGDGLWNLMPLNSLIALEHKIGGLTTVIETQLVAGKDHVSATQGEFTTPGYALLNLRGSYEWSNLRFDLGVDNLTNALYSLPLGGFDLTNYYRSTIFVSPTYGIATVRQVPGMGRNFYAGLTAKF